MDDSLQRLLDAEHQAEKLAREAEAEYEQLLQDAAAEARRLDDELTARVPALREIWISRSTERARTSIAQMERRFGERHDLLRAAAEENEGRALDAAFGVLLDPRI